VDPAGVGVASPSGLVPEEADAVAPVAAEPEVAVAVVRVVRRVPDVEVGPDDVVIEVPEPVVAAVPGSVGIV
ncbi:MAG: hypothetical protein KBA30_08810, partial [Clostridia bacterium]|nr:hypothetical protein [Clostridia bacterium]